MNMGNTHRLGRTSRRQAAFSLVELVMVIAIIAVLGAIAVPRLSQASQRAQANALQANLTNVRKAIDQYYAEHSRYPGYDPSNGNPDGNFFVEQLTLYTTVDGDPETQRDQNYRFGPYLSKPFPTSPTNGFNTVHVKALDADAVPKKTTGWYTCLENGEFGLNATVADIAVMKLDAVDAGELLKLPK
jgi:prepilin-type N-terminal cleavage/methylation domain-containing protein